MAAQSERWNIEQNEDRPSDGLQSIPVSYLAATAERSIWST